MNSTMLCVLLLVGSNGFMTIAWYGHLKHMAHAPWIIAALVSWAIASCEYLLQVPANRIGHQALSISQLKIIQEVISLSVFIPISMMVLGERPKLGYLLASVCMAMAVYFVFRFDR